MMLCTDKKLLRKPNFCYCGIVVYMGIDRCNDGKVYELRKSDYAEEKQDNT